ncbi:MAG: hypothetical protein KatS3mg101_0140 [Patescibacteria group bacterium]|nr:MAG: hypothetical protein KatS3mg101_0140 [Patescibacteria group bacterium]
MLKKENRISTPFEYKITKKYGQKIEGDTFFAYVLKPDNYMGPTKAGVVVSNKFSKKATARNKVKRLFREAIRKNLNFIPQNCWISVYPKFSVSDKTYEEIYTDFNKNLQKVSQPR